MALLVLPRRMVFAVPFPDYGPVDLLCGAFFSIGLIMPDWYSRSGASCIYLSVRFNVSSSLSPGDKNTHTQPVLG